MKKIFPFMAVVLTGCYSGQDEISVEGAKVVTFCTGVNVTRAADELNTTNLTGMVLMDYQDGVWKATVEQTNTDDGFGAPSVSLAYGEHDLYFVAHRCASPEVNVDAMTFGAGTVRDVFVGMLSLNVTPNTAATQTVTLDRANWDLQLVASDKFPVDAAKLDVRIADYYDGINYQTEVGQKKVGGFQLTQNAASYAGKVLPTLHYYGLANDMTDGYVTTVTVSALDADGKAVSTVVVDDVPLQANYVTKISGRLFSSDETGFGIMVDLDYKGQHDVDL